MAVMLMAKAFNIQVGNAGKKLVLLKLADNANDKGECWPSYQHIADQCEISKRSAMNYINSLINDGLIQKQVRKGPKGNSTNVYVLNLGGEKAAPHGANGSPPSESDAPPSEQVAPGGSEPAAPGISHSFESVSESVSEPTTGSAKASPAQKKFSDDDFEKFWKFCRKYWFGSHGYKHEALKEFDKLRPEKDDLHEILKLTRQECEYRRRVEAAEGFCESMKHVCRWIKVRGWEDVKERIEAGPALSLVASQDSTQVNRPHRPPMPRPDRAPQKPTGTGGDA